MPKFGKNLPAPRLFRQCEVASFDECSPYGLMAQQQRDPFPISLGQAYRVLVTVRPDSRPRDFIWQIVRDSADGLSIRAASKMSFKTMSDAYTAGAAALNKLTPS